MAAPIFFDTWAGLLRVLQRVTLAEVDAALRAQGNAAIGGIQSVVLETDGTLTVIPGAAR